ncbi:MAG: peptide-N-glycosidase F-related protein [Flavobacterium sp.]
MKKNYSTIIFLFLQIISLNVFSQTKTFKIFDQVLFYDGYAKISTEPVPEGIIRLRNDLYTTKLSDTQLQSIGSSLTAKITIKASCDNYDRIGNLNLALVPKNAATYNPNEVQRIELGRFITPFMNKNKTPDQVPYEFNINNITSVFKDTKILETFDLWLELEVFGVPYSARTEIAGCAGRSDVFYGTVEFITNSTIFTSEDNFLLPLNFKKNLNNYQAGASDAIGTTDRTIIFDVPNDLTGVKLYLITSNHGAGTNGEEYSRRDHYTYFDNVAKSQYKPGEPSCEPYRVYNTQGNGIYGPAPKSNPQWQSFSNWCPGSKIPTRTITIGNLSAGEHSFKISVPDAVFYNKDGYFPVSLYLQGKSTSTLGLNDYKITDYSLYPNPTNDIIKIDTSDEVKTVTIYDILGKKILTQNSNKIDLTNVDPGAYLAVITFANGKTVSEKIIRN